MDLDSILREQNNKLDDAMNTPASSGANEPNFDEHMAHFDNVIAMAMGGQSAAPEQAAPAAALPALPPPTQYPTLNTAPAPRQDMRYKYFKAPPASAAVTAPKLPGNYTPTKVTSDKETPATLPQAFSAPQNFGK
jgi:hypothetical protein